MTSPAFHDGKLVLWAGACSAARGRSHVRSGLACQDSVFIRSSGGVCCAALSDGAGSRPASQIGSHAAVRAVSELMVRRFDELCELAGEEARKVICEHVSDALKGCALRKELPLKDLACTLLAVAVRGDTIIACHIGDGLIAGVLNGAPQVFSFPENGEYANSTFFITDADALEHLRLYRDSVTQGLDGFVLMSDGSAESLYRREDGRVAGGCAKMLQWLKDFSPEEVAEGLKSNLEDLFVTRTTDDCSLAVLGSVRIDVRELSAMKGRHLRDLLGTRSPRYAANHLAVLDAFGRGMSTSAAASSLNLSRRTVRRHRRRLLFELAGKDLLK